MNGVSPNSASVTSVQAALAALKAGQMSLNQVCYMFYNVCELLIIHETTAIGQYDF